MPGKSPMKLEVTSRHDHNCLLGRKASKQTNKQTNIRIVMNINKTSKIVYWLSSKREGFESYFRLHVVPLNKTHLLRKKY